ncbi:Glycoside hydrolase, family 76 [Drechmeria coniospora]|uniref:mannan endo-1,6-alpha-mannosidase n=1 Tax=Drechmeria coniospora TaxID=98403 RepID=A0A151GDH6_DRECN|nr:Glycoside hydrolase, family 76 [Drechmeria coniospora]KYK55121.1 Glycoside hydrolase, family 76 [Drechmeria coniospora]
MLPLDGWLCTNRVVRVLEADNTICPTQGNPPTGRRGEKGPVVALPQNESRPKANPFDPSHHRRRRRRRRRPHAASPFGPRVRTHDQSLVRLARSVISASALAPIVRFARCPRPRDRPRPPIPFDHALAPHPLGPAGRGEPDHRRRCSPPLLHRFPRYGASGCRGADRPADPRHLRPEAIRRTAGTVAWDMMQYYKGNLSGATPGILPGPPPAGDYYWWEAGAMWGTLIDYWAWTGDATYNDEVMTAMQWQVGPGRDYQPPNVTASLGNDDQAFWGMSAMLAAESRFPDPPADRPQWLALAQAVFNTQAAPDRHDQDCGGGMHWQIYSFNTGYDYKNSIANGCFFNLGARLYRYTGNETYRDWAVRTWDWMEAVGYLDAATYAIYDGAHGKHNCTDINMAEFSYNNAVFAQGAAFLYNATEDAVWKARTERLVSHGLKTFFPEGVAVELPCEKPGTCTTDMLSFKGFLHRWYAVITQMVPSISASIAPMLAKSAAAAIRQCTGGAFGRQCGFQWATGTYDGRTGVSQQMSVLGAVLSQLIGDAKSPVTAKSGGTSKGDPNAGARSSLCESCRRNDRPVTVGDRVGAGMLTFALVALATGLFGWIIMDIRDS